MSMETLRGMRGDNLPRSMGNSRWRNSSTAALYAGVRLLAMM